MVKAGILDPAKVTRSALQNATLPDSTDEAVAALREAHQRAASERVEVAYRDRKSTRLNSSHHAISYAVFCLKKKNKNC